MRSTIRWTESQMQVVTAAIAEDTAPRLPPDVAAAIRAATRPSGGDTWTVDLDLNDGQRLKAWCDARRELATEQEPNETWTRIVARVNEAVQPFAPAKDASTPRGPATR